MTTFVAVLAAIIIPFLVSCFTAVGLFKRKKKLKRTPLTNKLLRAPGETLRREIELLEEKFDDNWPRWVALFFVPILILLVIGQLQGGRIHVWQLGFLFLLICLCCAWFIRSIYRYLNKTNQLRLGLDAELAVGQELNHLMRLGCHVYHDFPAEEFNIDHVVVGPGGVFAVETKGRSKPDKGRGILDAKVIYDGDALRFPDWHEAQPIQQSKRQAVWLSKWLSSATGEQINVRPVLALPGWFVERTKAGDVIVINGKSPHVLAKTGSNGKLSDASIQRISHQLEQRCRDVEPVAYRKYKK